MTADDPLTPTDLLTTIAGRSIHARTEAITVGAQALLDYYNFLGDAGVRHKAGVFSGESGLTDRAYVAEQVARVLCHIGVTTLNDLEDSGALAVAVAEAAAAAEQSGIEPVEALNDAVEAGLRNLAEPLDDGRASELLAQAQEVWRDRVRIHVDQESELDLTFDGCTRRLRPAAPLFIDRVSATQFFAADAWTDVGDPPDGDNGYDDSLYASTLAGLVTLREFVFSHARRMDAFGPTGRTGGGVAEVIAVVLIIGGVYVVAKGITKLAQGDANGWADVVGGLLMIVAGGCVLQGACKVFLTKDGISIPIGEISIP